MWRVFVYVCVCVIACVAMALTGLMAANAAAAAVVAGKKAAQVQLQTEINTDDEWNKFLRRDGLLVMDVYTEWCGPCIGMVGNLKKIKVEIGGDNLHLAIAKSDTIECLKRFRNRSEPTWMFIAGGQLLNVIFGADAPRLARTIEEELHNEEKAKRGEVERPQRAPHQLTPHEQEAANIREHLLEERRRKEAEASASARTARREARAIKLEMHFNDMCPALMLPHAQKHLRKVSDALEPYGIVVADKCPMVVSRELCRTLSIEDAQLGTPATMAAVAERPSMLLLFKKQPEKDGNILEIIRRVLCGDGMSEEERPKKTIEEEMRADNLPGIFVPADRHQRAAALDALFPKLVCSVVEPAVSPEPPHRALVFGAWQRRAVLAKAATVANRVLRYGFFQDPNVMEPKLLAKTLDLYEQRQEKDYNETLVLMVSVGLAEPSLAEEGEQAEGPPAELLSLGPLYESADCVVGSEDCARFFPPGYNTPEPQHKPKTKKKKKKRTETKEGTLEDAPVDNEVTAPDVADAGEGCDVEEDAMDEEETHNDKATSPPPQTPH